MVSRESPDTSVSLRPSSVRNEMPVEFYRSKSLQSQRLEDYYHHHHHYHHYYYFCPSKYVPERVEKLIENEEVNTISNLCNQQCKLIRATGKLSDSLHCTLYHN